MRPFWLEQALLSDHDLAPALQGAHSADVAIVGGGYTGQWSAIQTKQQSPPGQRRRQSRQGLAVPPWA